MIKAEVSTTQSYKCAPVLVPSTSDPIYELDSHANIVVSGNHSFVFEKIGRNYNVQPFFIELGIAANVPIFDREISYDCPYRKPHTR